MPDSKREDIEGAISKALLADWDPLGVRELAGEHHEYDKYAHDIYGLLARGGSDVQMARHLHHLERDDMGHPDAEHRDVTKVVRDLRVLERSM
jgi:hypothetical protein